MLMARPIAAAVGDEQGLASVGQRDNQRMVAPLSLVVDADACFFSPEVSTWVPSASMIAQSKNSRGCSFQTRSRTWLKPFISCRISASPKRRQKSPAVVGSRSSRRWTKSG